MNDIDKLSAYISHCRRTIKNLEQKSIKPNLLKERIDEITSWKETLRRSKSLYKRLSAEYQQKGGGI